MSLNIDKLVTVGCLKSLHLCNSVVECTKLLIQLANYIVCLLDLRCDLNEGGSLCIQGFVPILEGLLERTLFCVYEMRRNLECIRSERLLLVVEVEVGAAGVVSVF